MTAAAHPVFPEPVGLPDPAHAQVWIDFDGTITQRDVLDELITRFAVNDSWKLVEERWRAALIGSRQCLEEEFALLRVGPEALAKFLNEMAIDSGLLPLLELLSRLSVPYAILSDGVEQFIRPILRRAGVAGIQIRCNAIAHQDQRLSLQCPYFRPTCESAAAHCKCESIKALGAATQQSIYIGDGRSDLCPARKASIVFAKNTLAANLTREGIPFIRYHSLQDVASILAAAWTK